MYNLTNKSGLLYADISLSHNGKVILVPDVIIDTGACQSIILTEYLFDLGIGTIEINDIDIDFGTIDPKDRINGLIGMDFLKKSKSIININRGTLSINIKK